MRAALAMVTAFVLAGCGGPAGPAGLPATSGIAPSVTPFPHDPRDPAAAVAIAFAEAQLGKRYCWGGTGPSCFDCSGLVQSAWRAAGARLPRTTNDQARALVTVPLEDVRPGDIFWWSHGHVGLYVGDGAIIDAYHSGAGVVRRRAPRPERVLRVMPSSPTAVGHEPAELVAHAHGL
jgi:hypothetical protein